MVLCFDTKIAILPLSRVAVCLPSERTSRSNSIVYALEVASTNGLETGYSELGFRGIPLSVQVNAWVLSKIGRGRPPPFHIP
jgi:hypothetical protein